MLALDYSDKVLPPQTLKKMFPRLDQLRRGQMDVNPHLLVKNVLTDLHSTDDGKSGFQNVFEQAGSEAFAATCHQCSYAFALVLSLRGLKCTLLDCFEIESPEQNGWKVVKSAPEARFVEAGLDYNPYCLVAVSASNMEYLVSAKHFVISNSALSSLLSPQSHAPFTVGGYHRADSTKSGIYIGRIFNEELQKNYPHWDHMRFPVWLKSDGHSKKFYKTFQRVPLTL
jgi:hypothetical protein